MRTTVSPNPPHTEPSFIEFPMRWHEISPDPNSQECHAFRRGRLNKAAKPPVSDRLEYLSALAHNKRVADLGIVNHTVDSSISATWLHDRIRTAASHCLGLDILEAPLNILKDRGYNVRCWDITSSEGLGEKFDLIVAGEIIEHLGNPEALFRFAREHLLPGGRLAISTPHPYYLTRMAMFTRRRDCESVDHVALYFPSGVAELAERAGMHVVEFCGVLVPIRTWKGRLIGRISKMLGWSNELLCDTLIFVCEVSQ